MAGPGISGVAAPRWDAARRWYKCQKLVRYQIFHVQKSTALTFENFFQSSSVSNRFASRWIRNVCCVFVVRGAGCSRKGTTCLGANADDSIGTPRICWCQHDSMRAMTLSKARICRERYTNVHAWKATYVNKWTYMKRLTLCARRHCPRLVYGANGIRMYIEKILCE